MRKAFAESICRLAQSNPRIWLVTGDLGYGVLEPFRDRFPNRFVNVGVAEQNMLGVAAGLALAGNIPFVYSIVNFPVMRSLEQLRNDVAYHNLPVKLITVGGGLVYGAHGYSHHGAEDLGVVRLLPNFSVTAPADPFETRWATEQIVRREGPDYLRLARGGEPCVHTGIEPDWRFGRPIQIRRGYHLTIAVCGPLLAHVLEICDRLSESGHSADVFSVPTISPLEVEAICRSACATGSLLSIEDHGPGGLATVLAENYSRRAESFRFRAMTYQREPLTVAGSNDYLRGQHGMSQEALLAAARDLLTGC